MHSQDECYQLLFMTKRNGNEILLPKICVAVRKCVHMKEVYLKSIFRMAAFVFCKYTEFLTFVVTVTGNIWVWSFSFNFRINTFYTCTIAFKSSDNLPQSGIFLLLFFRFFRNSVSCLWVGDERIILKLFFKNHSSFFFLKLRAWRQHIFFQCNTVLFRLSDSVMMKCSSSV